MKISLHVEENVHARHFTLSVCFLSTTRPLYYIWGYEKRTAKVRKVCRGSSRRHFDLRLISFLIYLIGPRRPPSYLEEDREIRFVYFVAFDIFNNIFCIFLNTFSFSLSKIILFFLFCFNVARYRFLVFCFSINY